MAHSGETERLRRPSDALRRTAPGAFFPWVKAASYIELALFAALLFFWLAPGFEGETFVFGLSHGIGFIVLCLLVWIAVLRHEVPYTLLAATLTPAGPVGSVIGIAVIERRTGARDAGSGQVAVSDEFGTAARSKEHVGVQNGKSRSS